MLKGENPIWLPVGVKPVVWFTTKPSWEHTATKDLMVDGVRTKLTFKEAEELGMGFNRIEVRQECVRYR